MVFEQAPATDYIPLEVPGLLSNAYGRIFFKSMNHCSL